MKFTKDEAGKELIRKMTLNGETISTSERSVNEYLDVWMPNLANDDMELSEFVEKTLPILQTSENNMRRDISLSIKSINDKYENEVKELKSKLETMGATEKQKQNSNTSKKEETGSVNDSKIDAILEELNLLKKQREEDEAKNIVSKKKELLVDVLKGKGIKKKEEIDGLLSLVSLTKDTNVDEVANNVANAFNKMKASTGGTEPLRTSRGGKDIDYSAEFSKL